MLSIIDWHRPLRATRADLRSVKMTNPPTTVVSSPLTAEIASLRGAELATALRVDLMSYHGPSICFGIMLAGAAYPFVVATLLFVFFVVKFLGSLFFRMSSDLAMDHVMIALYLLAYAAFGALLCMIWAGILSMITLPIVYWFVRSLKLHGSIVRLAAVSGGLIGFIASLPLTLSLPWTVGLRDIRALFILLPLGPGLATVVGQIGGAWGGLRAAKHIANYYGLSETPSSEVAHNLVDTRLETKTRFRVSTQPDRRMQFGIRHMMWLMVWLSVLLSVIRWSGIPFEFALSVLVGWLVFQWMTLRSGEWLCDRLGPRWQAWRSARST